MTPGGVDGKSHDRSFRPSDRLRLNREFQRVYREGRSVPGALLVLFYLTAPDLPRKAGVVASRRVGNAVRRNRAKRLLREAYRHLKWRLPERGVQLVLVARRGCGDSHLAEVQHELTQLLARARLVEPGSPAPASG